LTRRDTTIAAGVLALAVTLWFLRWRGVDYPAQIYRVDLVRRHGLALWNVNWYGGHHTPGYGIVFPWVASVTGLAIPAIVSTVASVVLLARLMRQAYMPHVATGSCVFAFLMLINLYEGRLPFALGVMFGLVAITLARAKRWVWSAVITVLATLSSPVAGAFVALAFAAWALVAPRVRHRDLLREPRIALAALGVVPSALVAMWFPEGGWFPYMGVELVLALIAAVLVWLLFPHSLAPVRWGFALAAAAAVPLYFVPNPMGGNLSRLAVIGAPIVWSAPRRRTLLHVGVGLMLVVWQARPLLDLPARVEDPSAKVEYHLPLIAAVEANADGPVRIEVPFTAAHWEAAYIAPELPLARGWERQLDHRYNQVLYDDNLDDLMYRDWLFQNGVSFVAVPDVPLEGEADREAALVSTAPYLGLVWQNEHWKLYEVRGTPGLVTGNASLLEVTGDKVRMDVHSPGLITLRVRYSSHLRVADDRGCVAESYDGWTTVHAFERGLLELSTNLDPVGGSSCG
jgi:hypothetical protein